MKIKKFLLVLLGILLLTLPGTAYADEIVKLTGDIEIQRAEVINGDVVAMTGNIKIFGKVNGNVTAFKGDISLEDDSEVNGDITVFAGRIHKSSRAVVTGDSTEVGRSGVKVVTPGTQNIRPETRSINHGLTWSRIVLQLLGLAALTLLGFSLFSKSIDSMHDWVQDNFGQVFLKGLLGWIALPFLLIALIITILGIPVALFVLILLPVPIITGLWVVGLFTGNKVLPLLKKDWQRNLLIEGVSGVVIIWLAVKAPFLGFLVLPVIAVIGLGVILDSKFGTGKPWLNNKKGDDDNVA
ncbi:MAG: hypothetical protein ACOWWO_03115 [Peptococcaceae bacterium]